MTMTREEQIYKKAEGDCIAMLESIERGDIVKGSICPQSYRAGFMDGAKWADQHPQWIPVEKRLPEEQKSYLFRFNDGTMRYEIFYPGLRLSKSVTHWMDIVPPEED